MISLTRRIGCHAPNVGANYFKRNGNRGKRTSVRGTGVRSPYSTRARGCDQCHLTSVLRFVLMVSDSREIAAQLERETMGKTFRVIAQLRRAHYTEPTDEGEDGEWNDVVMEQREYQSRAAAVKWLRQRITALAATEPDEWYTGTATEYALDPIYLDEIPVADLDAMNRDELEPARWYSN